MAHVQARHAEDRPPAEVYPSTRDDSTTVNYGGGANAPPPLRLRLYGGQMCPELTATASATSSDTITASDISGMRDIASPPFRCGGTALSEGNLRG
jgi:hypothetical protein